MSDNPCADCGGRCCSFRTMRISFTDLDDGQRYDSALLEHEAGLEQLLLDDGSAPDMEWFTYRTASGKRALGFDCNHLDDDGRCEVYEDRPEMCRNYRCSVLRGEETLDEFLGRFGIDGREAADIDREVTDRVTEIIEREAEQ